MTKKDQQPQQEQQIATNQKQSYFFPDYNPETYQKTLLIPEKAILVFRIIISLYMIAIQAYAFQHYLGHYFKFLTYQSAIANLIYFVAASIEILGYILNKPKPLIKNNWKIMHVAFELGISLQLPIVAMYWLLLSKNDNIVSVSNHGVWFVFITFEFFINRIKPQKRHAIFLFIYLVICLGLNLIYTLLDEPVYSIITYDNLASYIYIIVLAVASFLNFLFICWLGKKYKTDKRLNNSDMKTSKVNSEKSDENNTDRGVLQVEDIESQKKAQTYEEGEQNQQKPTE